MRQTKTLRMWQLTAFALVFLICVFVVMSGRSESTEATPVVLRTELRFISIGDFGVTECGRRGSHKKCDGLIQANVAKSMDHVSKSFSPNFILSLGDNFYPYGTENLDDSQFVNTFEHVYNLPNLKELKWLVSVGDHDHCGNVSSLIDYGHGNRGSKWIKEDPKSMPKDYFQLPSPYYHKYFRLARGEEFHLIVTDSVGLEGAVGSASERRFAERLSMEYAGPTESRKQWAWLEETLVKVTRGSAPRIVMVVGHRPVFSCTARSRTVAEERMSLRLEKMLSQFGVNMYINGHDHSMQHILKDGVNYFGNGVGGFDLHKIDIGNPWPPNRGEKVVWAKKAHGFALHELNAEGMRIRFAEPVENGIQTATEKPTDPESTTSRRDAIVYETMIPYTMNKF